MPYDALGGATNNLSNETKHDIEDEYSDFSFEQFLAQPAKIRKTTTTVDASSTHDDNQTTSTSTTNVRYPIFNISSDEVAQIWATLSAAQLKTLDPIGKAPTGSPANSLPESLDVEITPSKTSHRFFA